MTTDDQTAPESGYKRALDIPSVRKIYDTIQGFKAIPFLPEIQKAELEEQEKKFTALTETVDTFYDVLGPRHWVLHDKVMPVAELGPLLAKGAEEAERGLVSFYADEQRMKFAIMSLGKFEPLRARMPLIERAREDHRAGRYYAVVLTLLPVMDGFVNDFEKVHRGLHARDAAELVAWDSVVGHHMGLSSTHKVFTKSFSKRQDEPIYELHRNGILHGNLTDFDNDVVASKAWNYLFAVADWAQARLEAEKPPEPEPDLAEALETMAETRIFRENMAKWEPYKLSTELDGEDIVLQHGLGATAHRFLELWQRKNYGVMAGMIETRDSYTVTPAEINREFRDYELTAFEILTLEGKAPVIGEAGVRLTINGTEVDATLRCIYGHEERSKGVDGIEGGEWRVYHWQPDWYAREIAMLRRI